MANWLDLSNNANTFKSSYFNGFIDVSGTIQNRNVNDRLIICGESNINNITIAGDANFNQKVYISNDISWNPSNIANNSIPSSAIIGGGPTGPQCDKGELGPTGPQGVTGSSADINSIIQTGTFSVTAVKNNEQNTGSNTSVTLNDTGYYYKIGKMVHVSYPRLTKTLLSMTANETLISLSLPFTCDKIASRVCAGQGVSGISMTDGLPTMIATSGNSTLECKYFTESNVDSVILFNSSSDYVDVTFDYISQ